MKLVRFGPAGQVMPGLVGAVGRIRDLSAHVRDLAGVELSPKLIRRYRIG